MTLHFFGEVLQTTRPDFSDHSTPRKFTFAMGSQAGEAVEFVPRAGVIRQEEWAQKVPMKQRIYDLTGFHPIDKP